MPNDLIIDIDTFGEMAGERVGLFLGAGKSSQYHDASQVGGLTVLISLVAFR